MFGTPSRCQKHGGVKLTECAWEVKGRALGVKMRVGGVKRCALGVKQRGRYKSDVHDLITGNQDDTMMRVDSTEPLSAVQTSKMQPEHDFDNKSAVKFRSRTRLLGNNNHRNDRMLSIKLTDSINADPVRFLKQSPPNVKN